MRLHDVQVVLSGTSTADKLQHVNQQQGQTAQAQNAMQLAAQTSERLTQTQQTEHEAPSKNIDEKERRRRNRNLSAQQKQEEKDAELLATETGKLPANPKGNIIDIKI
jgi:hypothetical protein